MYIQMYMIDTCISFICIYTCIYIYIRMRTPHQDLPSFVFHWLFHCKVNHLLSAICHLPKKSTNTNKKTKNTKNKCIGEPSPLPPSQSRSPKTPFFWLFLLVFFKDLIPKPNLIHLASKASCVYQMHPSQTIIKKVLYAKHAQVFPGDVQFSF